MTKDKTLFHIEAKDVEIKNNSIKLSIGGCPYSQPAPRIHNIPTGRGAILYDPAEGGKKELRRLVRGVLGLGNEEYLFPPMSPIKVESLHFLIPRPKYHFKAGKPRCIDNLKAEYQGFFVPVVVKPDIDNLEKFLFDALKGAVTMMINLSFK